MGAGLVCDIRICLDLRAGPDLRCAHLIRIGRERESQDVVTFFLLYYQEAARRWESMIPTLQIYLPIALCQLSDYNRALKLLACMQKKAEEEAILVWRQKPRADKTVDALKETLFQTKKSDPTSAKGAGGTRCRKKYEAYERIWREKGES